MSNTEEKLMKRGSYKGIIISISKLFINLQDSMKGNKKKDNCLIF